jgi:endoglucanase
MASRESTTPLGSFTMTDRMVHWTLSLLLGLTASECFGQSQPPPADAHDANRRLGRSINLGNALEAPSEGAWGLHLEEGYFEAIRRAGFDSVRIPIRWSAHAQVEPPFTIDPAFFERVDWAIDQGLSRNLAVVINVHHFDEVYRDPDRAMPRLEALWRQVAEHYKDRPATLYFELLNEPNGRLNDERWNAAVPGLLAAVRASNPERYVIVGPGSWNNVDNLEKLQLPDDDHHLIATFHYYKPFEFTHQGASWAQGSERWLGRTWTGTPEQLAALRQDFDKAAAWAKAHDRPLYLGEFGAYERAPMESRVAWTRAVTREAEARGFSWGYWEFGAGFGAYDPRRGTWRDPLLHALIPPRRDGARSGTR